MRQEFFLKRWHDAPLPEAGEYEIQIRYRSRPMPCEITFVNCDVCKVRTQMPLRAVTPGQIGALYRGEELFGGGIIDLGEKEQ